MKQADLLTSGLSANGNDTPLDIGRTHPLIDTNLNDQSLGNRAYAADKYATSKDRRYRHIINDNNLPAESCVYFQVSVSTQWTRAG